MAGGIGNWQAATENILKHCKTEEVARFKSLPSEEDKIRFVIDKNFISSFSWLQFYLESCDKLHLKSVTKSVESRNLGNKLFQAKKYPEALSMYTKSVLTAPASDSEDLGLAYGNHSAAHYYLQQYQPCIEDIELSLENGYPQSGAYKLYLRWAHCLYRLGRVKEALEKLSTAKKTLLAQADLDGKKKDKLLEEMESLEKNILSNKKHEVACNSSRSEEVELFEGINTVLPQASSAVEMMYTPEKGRYLQACSSIPAGRTIITEKPYASVLLPAHYDTHCHHCVGKLIRIVPCRRCSQVLYCTDTCRQASWDTYHRIECQYLDICHSIGIAHLSLRIVLTAGLQYLLEFKDKLESEFYQNPSRVGGLSEEGTYDRSYLSVYDLMTHSQDIETEDAMQYTMTAALLLTILKQSGWLDSKDQGHYTKDLTKMKFTAPDLYIGGLLLRHIEQLVCNAHAITELQVEQTSDSSLVDSKSQERVATAIYPTTSLLNHSCDPSIIPGFDKDLLVVRVIKDVQPGEDIFNCYGPHHKRMKKSERQQALKTQYFFTCDCPPCHTEEEEHDIFTSYCCPLCRDSLKQNGGMCTCCSCDYTEKEDKFIKEEKIGQDIFVEGLKCLQKQDVKGAIKKFTKCIGHQTEYLYKHNKNVADCQDCLARCYAISEQYNKAVPLLQSSVCTLGKLYGEQSIEYANELHKFAGVLYHAGEVQEGVKVIDTALEIFTLHFGDKYDLVQELQEMKICLLEKLKL